MEPDRKTVLVMGVFVAAVFILAVIFLRPVTVNMLFEGGGPVAAAVPGVYRLADCVIISLAAFLLGITSLILVQSGLRAPRDREMTKREPAPEIFTTIPQLPQNLTEDSVHEPLDPDEQATLLNLLKGNERIVAETLMNYGEMNQADLSARTGIPKSTLSRTLQNLEERKLIFRYDNGMSKMVKLEIHR
ncbi:MAG: helix-turn-helix domain-containing protein [Methanoregula sp.]